GGDPPYMLAFLCHRHYMEGNLHPDQWADLLCWVQGNVAEVRIVAREKDLEFAAHVLARCYNGAIGHGRHVFDQPFASVLAQANGALAIFGVAGGPTIVASQLCPALIAYPGWLAKMP